MENKSFKKIKFILVGFFVLAVLFLGGFLNVSKASADCLISSTLRAGNKNNQVLCLQQKLGMTVSSTNFGPLTLSAVKAFQAKNGLKADGIVGPKTISLLGKVTGTLKKEKSGLALLCEKNKNQMNASAVNICAKIESRTESNLPSSPGSPTPPAPPAQNPQSNPLDDDLQLTIGNITTSGTTATVPIVANNFTNMVTHEYRIKYDPSIGKPTFNLVVGGDWFYGWCANGYCRAGTINVFPLTIPDGTVIANIVFEEVSDGTSTLAFVNQYTNGYSENEYWASTIDFDPNTPTIDYIGPMDTVNGSVTFTTPVRPHLNIPAPKLTVQSVSLPSYPPATTVSVPITVDENFNDVKLMYLKIHFDENQLTFGAINQYGDYVNGALFNSEIIASAGGGTYGTYPGGAICHNLSENPNSPIYSPGDIICDFYPKNQNDSVSLPNGATLLTLNFTRKISDPIDADITFVNIDDPEISYTSEFFNDDYYKLIDTPTANHYVGGTVEFSSMPLPPPIANPPHGSYDTSPIIVTLSNTISDVSIYYTLDDSTPTTTSTLYTSPITISSSGRLKAIATKPGIPNSSVMSVYYTLPTVAIPTVTPASGSYPNPLTVTISTTTPGATIYYTTDGSTPTTSSTMYTSPIVLSSLSSSFFKAIATKSGMANSPVRTMVYTINNPQAATPTANPIGGTYSSAQTINLSSATPGAIIRYTTDNTIPINTSAIYTSPIMVSSSLILNARAFKSGLADSTVMSESYTINSNPQTVATPTASPTGGTYTTSQNVVLSTATSGATIYYTTNGATPTTSSTQYTSPITVSSSLTLKAIAVKSGMTNSAVMTQSYTINSNPQTVATPTVTPQSGLYFGDLTVIISTSTLGASIYYTLDDSTPTTSSNLYTSPFTISAPAATFTLKAKAFKSGMTDSFVESKFYTLNIPYVVMPTANPAGGTYTNSQAVILSSTTPGAIIRYTTDNTIPINTSPIYTSPIIVSSSLTLNARAFKSGMTDSSVMSESYIIN